MSKESTFLIYCMERYRHFKGISGSDAARLFDEYNIYEYITKYFEALHTMGDHCIVQDIDDYISSRADADEACVSTGSQGETYGAAGA